MPLDDSAWLGEYKKALDESNIVSITDLEGRIVYANEKFCEISGYSQEELLGKPHNIIRHPDTPKETFRELWNTIQAGKTWQGLIKNRTKDGRDYLVHSTIIPIFDQEGKIIHYMGVRHDLTPLIEKEQLIARHIKDDLTHLPNRSKLLEDITTLPCPTLSLINIDGFSQINDFYGLSIGDEVLKSFAHLLQEAFGEKQHRIYRLHSDEFAILTPSPQDEEDHFQRLKNFLMQLKQEPILFEAGKIYLSATAGSAAEKETIMGKANMALRYAREEKQLHKVYDETLLIKQRQEENLEWIHKIQGAIRQERIISYFQPIYDVKNHRISKYEALVRLMDEEGAIIAPWQFLDIAKQSRQYPLITQTMLSHAAIAAKTHQVSISVNLTTEDLTHADVLKHIDSLMRVYGCAPYLIFEITETEEIRNYDDVRNFIRLVKGKYGSKIAIDDFGSGYSNFEHLLELEFDYLKIDGSIISKLETHGQSHVLIDAIVAFTQKLGIKTVAEFVSSKAIFDLIKEKGIDFAQGYFIGTPQKELLPAEFRLEE
ncbi:GGDEF domain-containing phosphodiesterase [Wolinella succinogenes]|uniref:GGDEF domain-containing phosphodiesterase n=1 Tax=Wolinella succinogenes TaxID=844 RepID=UPI002409E84D|nr:GGDEF domain-containing phosphodiesterase [Wolinella succinogenes]